MFSQEDDGVTLGLSTSQALVKLRDQLSTLLDQHQRAACRQASALVVTLLNIILCIRVLFYTK